MDVKEAVRTAKEYIADLFANEGVSNLGLEEVEFDDGKRTWQVTIGFSRPWDRPSAAFTAIMQGSSLPRSYKVVRIDDASGHVLSVKARETRS